MPNAVKQTARPSRKEARPALAETRAPLSLAVSRFLGKRIHFIGVGGCGMSGLAQILLDNGAIVSGSETRLNGATETLSRSGARISEQQDGSFINTQTDCVVRTAAVKDDNIEFLAAIHAGVRTIKYAQMLGEIMAERHGVAVAGTHGKSTTTAMIAYALLQCGRDPSFVVGGTVPQLGGGSRSGGSELFVAEACEFDRSFHHLRPTIALITNIEEDHLDCYKNLDEIVESFNTFAKLVPPGGKILAGAMDANIARALEGITAPIELCGIGNGFAWSVNVTGVEAGCYRGIVSYKGESVAALQLLVPGEHNLINATMAVAACHACGLEPAAAAEALSDFSGVDRRMTEIGQYNGATLADDYGHHPTEIRATLKAAKAKYSPKRLFCVFQPHQHSRTRFLLDDFAASFELADETILPDIYFVRDSEAEKHLVKAEDLVERINQRGQSARHLASFEAIIDYLKQSVGPGDLVLTMGAGNVWEIAHALAKC